MKTFLTFTYLEFFLNGTSEGILLSGGIRTSREGFVGKTSLGQIALYVFLYLVLNIDLEVVGNLGFLGLAVRTAGEWSNSPSSSPQILLDNSFSISDNLSLESILNSSFLRLREGASREGLTDASRSLSQAQVRFYICFNFNLRIRLF